MLKGKHREIRGVGATAYARVGMDSFKKQLVAILANVFIIDKSVSPFTITLNPKLNEELLDNLIAKTREIIINMYITCETDFSSVLKLFNEELIDKSRPQDDVDAMKRVHVKSDNEANLVLKISEPISIAQPLREKITNLGENMVDTEKGLKDALDVNIAKPLGELQDKTLAGVKALPIQIEELAKNKVIQTQEQLGNVANVAKEHAGNLVTGVQNRLEQLFSKAKVGGKKSKRHMRPLKNRKTKSKNK